MATKTKQVMQVPIEALQEAEAAERILDRALAALRQRSEHE